jgi:hypothetical protein
LLETENLHARLQCNDERVTVGALHEGMPRFRAHASHVVFMQMTELPPKPFCIDGCMMRIG